jgi:hypothetical protein
MMKRSWMAILAGVALGAVALSALPTTATADGAAACDGSKDNPCPLQKWMRANMGAASAASDNAALATAYDKVIAMNPDPSWATKPDGTGWVDISKAGAKAARAGDSAGAKAACKACHDPDKGWKDAYKKQYRTRPVN